MVIKSLEDCTDSPFLTDNDNNGLRNSNELSPEKGFIKSTPNTLYFPKARAVDNYHQEDINQFSTALVEIYQQKRAEADWAEFGVNLTLGQQPTINQEPLLSRREDWMYGDIITDTLQEEIKLLWANSYYIQQEIRGKDFEMLCQGDLECIMKLITSPLVDEALVPQDEHLLKEIFATTVDDFSEIVALAETNFNANNLSRNLPSESEFLQIAIDRQSIALAIRDASDRSLVDIFEAADRFSERLETLTTDLQDHQNWVLGNFGEMDAILLNLVQGDDIDYTVLNEHFDWIELTSTDIAIMQDILTGDVSSNDLLNLYETCASGGEGCPTALQSLHNDQNAQFAAGLVRMNRIIENREFISESQQIFEGLQAGLDIASALGLSEGDQKKVADGIFYAQTAFNIGAGAARIWAGDLTGTLQLLSGLNALAGNNNRQSAEQVPSPEMQAILATRREMHERFDRIEEQLKQIVNLQIELHKDLVRHIQVNREIVQFAMQENFDDLNYQLGEILNNQNIIQSQLRTLLNTDFNNCFTIKQTVIDQDTILSPLNKYQNYVDIYNIDQSGCDACLTGIRNRLASNDGSFSNGANINLSTFTVLQEESEYVDNEFDAFKKTATFFKWYYGDKLNNLDRATQLLLMPTRFVDQNQQMYCTFRNEEAFDFNLNI